MLAVGAGTAQAAPPGPPPTSAAPAAWIEAGGTAKWLAYASYCWDSACPRFASPASRTDLPRLRGAVGKAATLHLAFVPSTIRVSTLGAPGTRQVPAGRLARWKPARAGITLITVTRSGRGTVTYAVVVS